LTTDAAPNWAITKRVLVTAVIVVLVVLQLYGLALRRSAYNAYVASREGSIDTESVAFITRGVAYGDTEVHVDEAMRGAIEMSGKLQDLSRKDDVGYGFEKHYYFEYHPTVRVPFAMYGNALASERFIVEFDDSGGASVIDRSLYLHLDARRSGGVRIELEPDGKRNSGHDRL
jgi:hypothetical protein